MCFFCIIKKKSGIQQDCESSGQLQGKSGTPSGLSRGLDPWGQERELTQLKCGVHSQPYCTGGWTEPL